MGLVGLWFMVYGLWFGIPIIVWTIDVGELGCFGFGDSDRYFVGILEKAYNRYFEVDC